MYSNQWSEAYAPSNFANWCVSRLIFRSPVQFLTPWKILWRWTFKKLNILELLLAKLLSKKCSHIKHQTMRCSNNRKGNVKMSRSLKKLQEIGWPRDKKKGEIYFQIYSGRS